MILGTDDWDPDQTAGSDEQPRLRLVIPGEFQRGDHVELGDRLVEALGERAHLVYAQGSIYRYSSGVWRALKRNELATEVMRFAGMPLENRRMRVNTSAIDGAIAAAEYRLADATFFDAPRPGLAFADCFVEPTAAGPVRHEHSPDHRARDGHTFPWDPEADYAPLTAYFEDVFGTLSEEARAEFVAILQQHAGVSACGFASRYQRCILLTGTGGNGKSTLARIVYHGSAPDGSVASLAPQLWPERFQIARLIGKRVNCVDELPEAEIMKTGVFKSAIAGEPLTMEFKHRDTFESVITCGHVFCANHLPTTADLSEGFFRRFIVLPMGQRYDNSQQVNANIAAEIVAQCRPGIVRWAIQGACNLMRDRLYPSSTASTAAMDEWRGVACSVRAYIADRCKELDHNAPLAEWSNAASLYMDYKAWAGDNGLKPVSSKTLATRLKGLNLHPKRVAAGVVYPITQRNHWTSDT